MKMSLRTARSQHFISHAYFLRDYWKTPYSATRRKPRKKTWTGTRKGEPNKEQEQLSRNDADVVDQEDNPLMGAREPVVKERSKIKQTVTERLPLRLAILGVDLPICQKFYSKFIIRSHTPTKAMILNKQNIVQSRSIITTQSVAKQ